MIVGQYRIAELTSLGQMLASHDLLVQLSPHITRNEYSVMLEDMLKHGYRQVGVYDGEKCIGISGFWINTKLYSGKYVELDNVVIDKNYRSKGLGKLLCDWVLEEGRKAGCEMAMLDAYTENSEAHRFYFREGFFIRGFHFLKKL
jgi:GNAT superfamily N-acetyltransferase